MNKIKQYLKETSINERLLLIIILGLFVGCVSLLSQGMMLWKKYNMKPSRIKSQLNKIDVSYKRSNLIKTTIIFLVVVGLLTGVIINILVDIVGTMFIAV